MSSNPAEELRKPTGHGLVLVVDDEPLMRRTTERLLRDAGFDVVACGNGRAALETLRKQSFDVVITDVSMPEMNGIQLLRGVRSEDLELPVIMVTGDPTVDTAIQAIEFGAFKYLLKPLDFGELVTTTTRAIRMRSLARVKREALRALDHLRGVDSDQVGLQAAFDRGLRSLWPAFQPIVSASEREIFAYEALLRTDEPDLPHPGAMLDAAERLNQLLRLSRTMRERSTRTFTAHRAEPLLFLNLHPLDLQDPDLLEPRSSAAQMADRIVLEVTERVTLDLVVDARDRVARLRDMGYRIAIDDLGAGYAGLTSFASLEPEFVKLDMALIRDLDSDPIKQRLVRLMTTLCHDMGMQVVAEGIETIAERDCVVELGCDLLQGYRFGKPDRQLQQPSW